MWPGSRDCAPVPFRNGVWPQSDNCDIQTPTPGPDAGTMSHSQEKGSGTGSD